jgi:hypothetical protein
MGRRVETSIDDGSEATLKVNSSAHVVGAVYTHEDAEVSGSK